MAKTCPSCGYNDVNVFVDRCPICAEPVRHLHSNEAGGGSYGGDGDGEASPNKWPPMVVGGWFVIGLVLAYFFTNDLPWLVLSGVFCGAAWWAIARGETLLIRLVGGSLLILFVPGIWLASQPEILPGLDRRENTPERLMSEMMSLVRGTSPESLRTGARMKTVSAVIYAVHVAIAIPLALFGPPLLSWRNQRRLGGPMYLSRPQAMMGIAAWIVAIPLLGWVSWPTMQTWTVTPPGFNQMPFGAFPQPGRPPFMPNQVANQPEDDDGDIRD